MEDHDVLIFWLMFFGVIAVSAMAYLAISRSGRGDTDRPQGQAFPRNWLQEEAERRGWAGQDEGVVVVNTGPPAAGGGGEAVRCPPEAHVRS